MIQILPLLRETLFDIRQFAEGFSRCKLRSYQRAVAMAIVGSVKAGKGLTFVVIFPRQSGKNELQAQIETYLLTILMQTDAEIVKVSPTWKPQTLNAMRRLERVLKRNWFTASRWTKESGYIYKVGQAHIFFLSGSPTANVVGATASTLLQCDEAQDVTIEKWDKDFAPMAASTNATRVFWGTAWTSRTLLARELRAARTAEQKDGVQRVFTVNATDVSKEVPAYGAFVDEQIAKLGRNHPYVKTQYFCEEIDAEGGMFPPARLQLMRGDHAPQESPSPFRGRDGVGVGVYAMLVDVAGEDESLTDDPASNTILANAGRDSTTLTVVEVDLSSLADELIKAPTYRVVHRYEWVGVKHTALYGQLKALAELWQARYLVIDSTGIGAGLASFLDKALPNRVIPFVFTSKTKSELGWGFLAVIETGRYKEYNINTPLSFRRGAGQSPVHFTGGEVGVGVDLLGTLARLQSTFYTQAEACQSTILDSPGKVMRWGVPDGTRAPDGALVHDDLLISAALCSVLDQQPWGLAESHVIHQADPLSELKQVY